MALLREVRYLKQRDCPSDQVIPETALIVYTQEDTYRKFLQNLDIITMLYNKVINPVLASNICIVVMFYVYMILISYSFISLLIQLKGTVLEVEVPLIEEEMNIVNTKLNQAVTEVNWTTEGTFNI